MTGVLLQMQSMNIANDRNKNAASCIYLDCYRIIDGFVGEFIDTCPDAGVIVLTDRSHHSICSNGQPQRILKKSRLRNLEGQSLKALSTVRKSILDVLNRLNIEHYLIWLVVINARLTKAGKSMYSSAGVNRSDQKPCLLIELRAHQVVPARRDRN
jgi:hypothetical protein